MEANSLSSLTQLAGNPPKYPRNPTEPKHASLILYIQRVPGSKDIILTPLKPNRKNVTAEDVASSLYFVHYQSPDDINLLGSAFKPLGNDVNPILEEPPQPMSRKPVAQTPLVRQVPNAFGNTGRKPLPPLPTASTESFQPGADVEIRPPLPERSSIARRPLGPRAPSSTSGLLRKTVPVQKNLEPRIEAARNSYPPSTGRPVQEPTTPVDETRGFSVTLIRRDPTSGAQWNIGEISSQAAEELSKPCLSVHLSTPGYGQFCGHRATTNPDGRDNSQLLEPTKSSAPNTTFHRDIHMDNEQTNFWDTLRKRTNSDLSARSANRSSTSFDSRPSTDTSYPLNRMSPTKTSFLPSKPKAKGYVFTSPWNGRCEFSTGTSGRSLKCKHSLRNFAADGEAERPALVSELRFNIPTAEIFGATPQTFGKDTKRFSKLPKLRDIRDKMVGRDEGFRSEDEEEMEEEDRFDAEGRLDLSLGQEKAGGGNRGKRAKLGKLIVHDEGLKMLDLVVAANIGLWWATWER